MMTTMCWPAFWWEYITVPVFAGRCSRVKLYSHVAGGGGEQVSAVGSVRLNVS